MKRADNILACRSALLLGLAFAFSFAFGVAAGSPSARAEQAAADRWVPAFALMGGLAIQAVEASASSTDGSGAPLRNGSTEDDIDFAPFVGLNLQLMSSTLAALPGQPRLFVSGEIPVTFGVERNIAREGAADGLRIPLSPDGVTERGSFSEAAIAGQGSRTTATVQNGAFGAGMGLSFAFEWLERQLRLKPYVGWRRYEVKVVGRIFDAACAPSGGTTQCSLLAAGGQRRLLAFAAGERIEYDAVGPGIELEMDASRLGPFGVSIYAETRAYHVVDDRQLRLRDGATAPADPPAFPSAETFGARFDFEVDPWLLHAGVGVRFHWLGD